MKNAEEILYILYNVLNWTFLFTIKFIVPKVFSWQKQIIVQICFLNVSKTCVIHLPLNCKVWSGTKPVWLGTGFLHKVLLLLWFVFLCERIGWVLIESYDSDTLQKNPYKRAGVDIPGLKETLYYSVTYFIEIVYLNLPNWN